MAALFRAINFQSSSRHPSDLDVERPPYSRGVSPTSTPHPMSPAETSNPFGNAAQLPTPPPLSMGELAVKFGEQSLCRDDPGLDMLNTNISVSQLHHRLPTPPSEEDCIPNDVTGTLPTHKQTSSVPKVQYCYTRRRSSSCDRASEYLAHCQPSMTSNDAVFNHLPIPTLPHTACYGSFPRAADYEDLLLSPTGERDPWDLPRRRSTSALRPLYWTEAAMNALQARASRIGSGQLSPPMSYRGRGRRLEDRRRFEGCGINKAGRYRLGRRGAIST